MTDYDVVVVGARCAGSATALELASRGYDVLVVDRAHFPSDTLSTHYVQQRGASKLAEWGVLRDLERAGAPPVTENRWIVDGVTVDGTPPPAEHAAAAIAPRRPLLDKSMVDAARDAGAAVREGFTVDRLLRRDGRVVGISGREGTERVDIEADLVVGADGRYSWTADAVGAPTVLDEPVLTAVYYAYWAGVDLDRQVIEAVDGVGIAVFPTDGGLVNAAMSRPIDRFEEIRADVEGSFERDLARLPTADAILAEGERVTRVRGTGDLPNYRRRACGPGWVLVGDAVYHKDPLLAQGISDAFVEASALADAVDAGLSGDRRLDEALAGYEASLLEMEPMFELNSRLARLEVDDDSRAIFGAFGASRRNADRFLGTVAGTVPVADVWTPSRLRNLVIRHRASQVRRHITGRVRGHGR